MPEANTITAVPDEPDPSPGTTGDWPAAAAADSPVAHSPAEVTLTRTVASTPGPGHPERRTYSDDTERLRDVSADEAVLPTIPGFRVEAEIGHGGMGVVYRAVHEELNKTLALKVIYPLGRNRDVVRARFEREVQTLARIEHPNVVPIYHAGDWVGFPYFTMKYIPAGSLNRHMGRFTGNPTACARLMSKVARAIQSLHDHGIIHRDLKPLNILLGEGDDPLVADFGLAKCLDEEPSATTSDEPPLSGTGVPIGTRPYMSPEQTRGETTDRPEACDIWAIGVTLYELLAGQRPFTDAGKVDIYDQIRDADPPPLPATVPAELEAVALKCLAKNPNDRYDSAAAVAADLEAWVLGRPLTVAVQRRPRGWGVAAGLFALIALIALPASLMKTDQPPPSVPPKKSIAERLRNGETVTLIGTKGMPREEYYLLSELGFTGQPTAERDGFFTLHSTRVGAVEFCRERLPLPVIFEAEVALNPGHGDAWAGVYVARKETLTATESIQTGGLFVQKATVKFGRETNDLTEFARSSVVWWKTNPFSLLSDLEQRPQKPDPVTIPAKESEQLRWHKFVIRLESESIHGRWDKFQFPPITANDIETLRPGLFPPYLGDGLGVCVSNAEGVYRNVRLIPVRPAP